MDRYSDRHAGSEPARGRRLEGAVADAFPDATEAERSEIEFVRAPGRVNLIGDHTDHNDGLVLPAAIELDTWIAVRRRRDGLVRIASLQSRERASFWIDELVAGVADVDGAVVSAPRASWSGYVAAMAWSLREAALSVRGFDGVVDSTIPRGAGLAPAAALELASALALLAGARPVAAPTLAALAQRAERDFLGVDGGIVDQFASAAGRAGRAILLDCRSMESQYVALPPGVSVVVCDTGSPTNRGAPGELGAPPNPGAQGVGHESVFRERRAECGRAVALLAEDIPSVASLRDLDTATLRRNRHLLSETIARRAEHVVAENERVVATVAALDAGDLDELGRLFAASHESLRTLYEVSSPALDAMVEIARAVPGVVAARMTGAGLGGCTVNLVRDEAVPALERAVAAEYPRRTGLTPRTYPVATVDGAGSV
jgi:galactokinase